MKEAYDILKDAEKRKLYDKYGPMIIKLREGELGPQSKEAVELLLQMMTFWEKCGIVLSITIAIGFVMLYPILISLKWNGDVTYSWFIPFIPIWIMSAAFLVGQFCFGGLTLDPEEAQDEEAVKTFKEIKKAYRQATLEFRPDRFAGNQHTDERRKKAEKDFQILGDGLEILTDDFKRQLYDEGYDLEAIKERVEAAQRAAHMGGDHYHHGRR